MQHKVLLVFILGIALVGHVASEMYQELETEGNVTEQKSHALDIIRIDFHHTGRPLAVLSFVLLAGLMKPMFEIMPQIPPSVSLLVFGILIGYPMRVVFGNEIYLRPSWFFIWLLPPIVADAGMFLKLKYFFRNAGTISVYAVIGTLLNASLIGMILYLCRPLYSDFLGSLDGLSYAVFAVLISAVDPVAVLSVFEDVHVNEQLFICVFGESLLNDGVTIVLYNSIINMLILGADNLRPVHFLQSLVSFFTVSGMGIVCGFVGALICVGLQRLFVHHQIAQPALVVVVPYITYLLTDSLHFSGLLAIASCAVLVRNFLPGNACDQMIFVIEFVYRTVASYSESLIFVFLGVSLSTHSNYYDWTLIGVTLVSCLVVRFIVTYSLTAIINRYRYKEDKISSKDQFIMAYGGIRGAVCYGLAMSIDEELIPAKKALVSATMAVIIATTLFQGSTIQFMVKLLQVRRSKKYGQDPHNKKSMIEITLNESNKYTIEFLEYLTCSHEQNKFYRWSLVINEKLKTYLTAYSKPRTVIEIENHLDNIAYEYAQSMRRDGQSFPGLATDKSLISLNIPLSKSDIFSSGFRPEDLVPPSRPSTARPTLPPGAHVTLSLIPEENERTIGPISPQVRAPIPHVESVTGILMSALEETAGQREASRNQEVKRRSMYSRQIFKPAAAVAPISPGGISQDARDPYTDNYKTFTYGANPMMAHTVHKFAHSLREKSEKSPSKITHYQTYHAGAGKQIRPGALKSKKCDRPVVTVSNEEDPEEKPSLNSTSGNGRGGVEALKAIFFNDTNSNQPSSAAPSSVRDSDLPSISSTRLRSTSSKRFVVGEEGTELLPIHEGDSDDHDSESI